MVSAVWGQGRVGVTVHGAPCTVTAIPGACYAAWCRPRLMQALHNELAAAREEDEARTWLRSGAAAARVRTPAPAVLWVHGGVWSSGERSHFSQLATRWAWVPCQRSGGGGGMREGHGILRARCMRYKMHGMQEGHPPGARALPHIATFAAGLRPRRSQITPCT